MKVITVIYLIANRVCINFTGVRDAPAEQPTEQPCENCVHREGTAPRSLSSVEHSRRGGEGTLVRAENTIYGHFEAEKKDRRDYEEDRLTATKEGYILKGKHAP